MNPDPTALLLSTRFFKELFFSPLRERQRSLNQNLQIRFI